MTRLIVEGDLLEKLRGIGEKVELFDLSGRRLGVFDPTHEGNQPPLRSPISDEELQRRRRNPVTKPLSDVLARLNEV